jgi:hypothetical protein
MFELSLPESTRLSMSNVPKFRATLHGHHEAEDNGVFPALASEHPSVRATIENPDLTAARA